MSSSSSFTSDEDQPALQYEPMAIPTTIAPISYSGLHPPQNAAVLAQRLQGHQFTVVGQEGSTTPTTLAPPVFTHASPGSKVTYSLPPGTVLTPTATTNVGGSQMHGSQMHGSQMNASQMNTSQMHGSSTQNITSSPPTLVQPTVTRLQPASDPATRSVYSGANVSHQISAAIQASKLPVIATDASSPLARDPVHHKMAAAAAPNQPPAPRVALNAGPGPRSQTTTNSRPARRASSVTGTGESLAVKTNTLVTRTEDDKLAGPKAWVTVPVPDANGGVQFRPRGFSVDGSTEIAASEADSTPWDIRDKYLVAVRSGPTECPDHILVKHKHFTKKEGFTSPYTVFYFDETAPNAVLLDNDVRPSKAPVKDPKTGKRVPAKGAIRPKRKVSNAADDQSTNYTESETEDLRLPSRGGSLQPLEETASTVSVRNSKKAGEGTASVTSTHYVSMQPMEVAGCCGARKRVSVDGESYYGGSSTYDIKYDRHEPTDYVRVVTLSQDNSSSDSSSSMGDTRFYATQAAAYGDGHFVTGDRVPPSYPPNGSLHTDTSSYTEQGRNRACCGISRRHPEGSSSSSGSSVTTSSEDEYTSSSSMSSGIHRSSKQTSTTHNRKPAPVCGVCRKQARAGNTTSSDEYTSYTVSMPSTGSMTNSRSRRNKTVSTVQASTTSSKAGKTRTVTGSRTKSSARPGSSGRSSTVSSMTSSTGAGRVAKTMSTINEEAMTSYSSERDSGLPVLKPSTKRERDRDLSYNVRKMFFDVEDLRVPSNEQKGTGLKMLPGYSTSYRNFPVICYDVVAPKDYQEFFRSRKTPGMFA